ncbi:MAG: type I-C CRISPR-associated protein Cas7/Csd2 [Candidatus Abyssubacteria bacterium]
MTTTAIYSDPNRRHDFVLLFDVIDGNPNGDPDAGNLPRVDPETMQGLVTDVCLKRKVRNFVEVSTLEETDQERKKRLKIYVEHHGVLNEQHERAYTALGEKPAKKPPKDVQDRVCNWMCENFYDIRMFGAVMTTKVNCGQVRGPLQLTFARSLDPIIPLDLSITRMALTSREEKKQQEAAEEEEGEFLATMGRKALVPYGLYRGHGFFSPHLAERTGANADDLALFWQALQQMWDIDRSASRGFMACRGLYIFSHESKLGNMPAHALFNLVGIKRKQGVEAPRKFEDYEIDIAQDQLPETITLTRLVG